MTTFKLPIDDAWEQAASSLRQDDHFGSHVIKLDNYGVGHHRKYALIASVDPSYLRSISIAVQVGPDDNIDHLHKPARVFNLNSTYVGFTVENTAQAGSVVHIVEDAVEQNVNLATAMNYIADRIPTV